MFIFICKLSFKYYVIVFKPPGVASLFVRLSRVLNMYLLRVFFTYLFVCLSLCMGCYVIFVIFQDMC